ncbi:MAG: ExbD/TolR family protein [Planctomycetota bacterium]
MRGSYQDDESAEVQMAPLIDCVFLLLIFFLVSSTLKKIDEELPLTLPDARAVVEVQQPDDFLVIAIDREGGFYLDGAPVNLSMLQGEVRNRARANSEVKVRVDVDQDIPFKRAMEVLDLLRFEGIANVGINTRTESNYGG